MLYYVTVNAKDGYGGGIQMPAKGVSRTGESKLKPVLCPECGRGRLCDGNVDVCVFAAGDAVGEEKRLEIKCPKCGSIAAILLKSA